MVIIGRHVNGITINPLEYILDEDGDVMEFNTKEEAVEFLRDNGITDEEIHYLVFKEVQKCDRCGELVDVEELAWYGNMCICDDCYEVM